MPQGGRKCLYLAYSGPFQNSKSVSSHGRGDGEAGNGLKRLVFSAGSYLSYSSCSSHITHLTRSGLRFRLLTRSRLLV